MTSPRQAIGALACATSIAASAYALPYSRSNSVDAIALDRPRCLIAGEWLVLEPLDDGARTRLIARTRDGWLEPLARRVPLLWPLLWPVAALIERGPDELLHRYMETGMLRWFKERAEASQPNARVIEAIPA